jgi:hypothetical protein
MGRKQTDMHNATDPSFLGLMSFDSGAGSSQFSMIGFDQNITGQPLSKQDPTSRNFQMENQNNGNPLNGQRMYPAEFTGRSQRSEGYEPQQGGTAWPQDNSHSQQQPPNWGLLAQQQSPPSQQQPNNAWAQKLLQQSRGKQQLEAPDRMQTAMGVFAEQQHTDPNERRGIYPDRSRTFGDGAMSAEHFQPQTYMQTVGSENPHSQMRQQRPPRQSAGVQKRIPMQQTEYINPQHFHPNQVPSYGNPDQWQRMQGIPQQPSMQQMQQMQQRSGRRR